MRIGNQITSAAALATIALTTPVSAATWTGGGADDNWGTALNWTGGVPNNLTTDALFSGNPAEQGQPVVEASYPFRDLQFTTPGWVISGIGTNFLRPLNISSDGAGVNVITSNLNVGNGNAPTITVAQGNTLLLAMGAGELQLGRVTTKTGAGTLALAPTVTSTNGNRHGIATTAGTTLVNYSTNPGNNSDWTASGTGILGGTGSINLGSATVDTVLTARHVVIGEGGTLAPGGTGTVDRITADAGSDDINLGAQIESLNVTSANGPGGDVIMGALSTLRIDLGAESGVNDQLIIGGSGTNILDLTAVGNTLALLGPVTLPEGNTYTIATFDNDGLDDTAGNSYGVFEAITYNGLDASSLFSIAYNPTSIVLTSAVPEPTAALALLTLPALIRRRRVR